MPIGWRIITARFADTAFTGEGARRYGGRWNPKGVPLVYTAESQALAVLEILVQDEPLRARYVLIPAHIPDDLALDRITVDQLPPDWRSPEARGELQKRGADWVRGGTRAVLAVPSAVIPAETNYLLNPEHPDFARIGIGEPLELVTDLRLLKKVSP
ncbi:RES domain-containing protein [Methylocaldum sp. BRCS4]|nr:RES domain-containing protein [Methylocaldum sp. BRCS4]